MVKKRNHGKTMRFFLWSAFTINLCLFIMGILWKDPLIIIASILFSLVILHFHRRIKVYYSLVNLLYQSIEKEQSFYQYLKNILKGKNDVVFMDDNPHILRTSVEFSLNPDLSKGEAIVHALQPVKIKNKDLKVAVGSTHCELPFTTGLLNVDIDNCQILNPDLISGIESASATGEFTFSISNPEMNRCKEGTIIFKLPVNFPSAYCQEGKVEELIERLSSVPAVKGIELVYDTVFSSCYTLMDMNSNNFHFKDYSTLLQFALKLRLLSNGLPIGIRTGIGDKKEFIELCEAMKDSGLIVDFITIIGEDPSKQLFKDKRPNLLLEDAVAFVSGMLAKYDLTKEIKIFAAGSIENGFELLKLISLGSSACFHIKPARYFNQLPDDYFYDDLESSVKSNVLYMYRNIMREAIQIMEYAGFSEVEKINPRMFFRRINPFTIKNFEEIYLKNNSLRDKNIFEDYIHLN